MKLFIALLLICSISLADDVVPIQKDQPAPFNGLLFPQEKAVDARNAIIERDSLKAINLSLDNSVKYYQENSGKDAEKIKLLMDRNDQLSKNLNDERTVTNWERIAWIAAGVVLTGVAFYGLHAVSK